jgi:hypothetical protein
MHPREAVQHLTQEVLGASSGELRDADSGANR